MIGASAPIPHHQRVSHRPEQLDHAFGVFELLVLGATGIKEVDSQNLTEAPNIIEYEE